MTIENVEKPLSAAEAGRLFSGSYRPSAFLLGQWHSAACEGQVPSDLIFNLSCELNIYESGRPHGCSNEWRAHAFRADILPREGGLKLREAGTKLKSFTKICKNDADDLFANPTLYLSPALLWYRLNELAHAALCAKQPLGRSGKMKAGNHMIGYRAVVAPLRNREGKHGVIGTLEHVILDNEDANHL